MKWKAVIAGFSCSSIRWLSISTTTNTSNTLKNTSRTAGYRSVPCVSNLSNLFLFYNFSIGDWFVLYQMNKNMNKRFFAEFVALLSMKVEWRELSSPELIFLTSTSQVNPEPDEQDDPEISVLGGQAGRAEDNDEDYYDIDETGTE